MTSARPPYAHKDALDVLLDKISNMREELLTIERALERMQAEPLELANAGTAPAKRAD